MKQKLIIIISVLSFHFAFSQNAKEYKYWNPARDSAFILEGQAWPKEVKDYYDRLPASAENVVRKPVWELSKNSAGLKVRFRTNSPEIIVRYAVTGGLQMPHMPATGVSGVDLYARNPEGDWLWAAGRYSFGDTIIYRFTNLSPSGEQGRDYDLYLPLYNSVKWMEIGIVKESLFKPLSVGKDKPIVVYGTSIAQGGCASRPGLAWPAILNRKLNLPVINLAFSGNGRLEKEVIDFITKIDARLYVLDCLPNLTGTPTNELKRKIVEAIKQIQLVRPNTPILLADHDGYMDEKINLVSRKSYQDANNALKNVFDSFLSRRVPPEKTLIRIHSTKGGDSSEKKRVKNIFLLTKNDINQDIESTVDGVHPNDIGMMHYAEAYEKKIKSILR
jgi:lysophospholipase L1-like esterase